MSQQIQGFDELKKKLKQLPKNLQAKATQAGVRSAAAHLAAEARRQIAASDLSPTGKKILRRALRTKSRKGRGKLEGFVLGSVIITAGKKYQEKNADAWWWPFIEIGTRERTRKSGGSTGAVRARKIFKAAFDAAGSGAIDVGSVRIREQSQREIDKMRAR